MEFSIDNTEYYLQPLTGFGEWYDKWEAIYLRSSKLKKAVGLLSGDGGDRRKVALSAFFATRPSEEHLNIMPKRRDSYRGQTRQVDSADKRLAGFEKFMVTWLETEAIFRRIGHLLPHDVKLQEQYAVELQQYGLSLVHDFKGELEHIRALRGKLEQIKDNIKANVIGPMRAGAYKDPRERWVAILSLQSVAATRKPNHKTVAFVLNAAAQCHGRRKEREETVVKRIQRALKDNPDLLLDDAELQAYLRAGFPGKSPA